MSPDERSEGVSRRRFVQGASAAAASGGGLAYVARNRESAGSAGDGGAEERDVVVFCGPRAVFATVGGTVVAAGPDGTRRRESMDEGFCYTVPPGESVVGVRTDGEWLPNPDDSTG